MLATRALSAVLVVVFAVQLVVGVRPSIAAAGLVKELVADGDWWRLLTACFLHANLLHLLANLGALEAFGRLVDERTSARHLLAVYLSAGIGGSLFSLWLSRATSIGASGAVLGLVAFSLVIGYRERADAPALFVHARKVQAALKTAATMPPADAERLLTGVIDVRAAASEQARQPVLITELLTARREAELHPDRFAAALQTLTAQTQRMADSLRRCDAR